MFFMAISVMDQGAHQTWKTGNFHEILSLWKILRFSFKFMEKINNILKILF